MKLDERADIERIGNLGNNEKEFTFKLTAKAFQLTIAGIYQNKVGAVVREIFSNAHDSHTKAGNTEPVIIKLPYGLDPYFVVEDNGVGMSPEDVLHYYSTVFDSTKDQSNDEIGAFGLGSKSPFTITDSFEIQTRWNGIQYNFITLKNESGIPSIMQLGQLETSAPNGVTIKVPIAESQFNRFETEVKEQLKFFDNKPIVYKYGEVCENFEWKEFNIDNDLGAIKVLDRKLKNYYTQTTWVVMGGVGYPVDIGQLGDEKIEKILPTFIGDVIIDMPMGSVEIESSREGLEYTNKTIEAIKDFLNDFFDEYERSVREKIDELETDYEIYAYIAPIVEGSMYWQRMGESLKYKDGSRITNNYGGMNRLKFIDFPDNYKASSQHRRQYYNGTKIERTHYSDQIPFMDLVKFKNIIIVDEKIKYTANRIREAIEINERTLVVEDSSGNYDFQEFFDSLTENGYTLPEIKHIGDLPYTPPTRLTTTKSKQDEYVAGVKYHGSSGKPSSISQMDTSGYYVYFTGSQLEDEVLKQEYIPVYWMLHNVRDRPEIYNIMKTGRKYVPKLEDSGLRHINHFIEESIAKKLDDSEINVIAKYIISDLTTYWGSHNRVISRVDSIVERLDRYLNVQLENKLYQTVREHFRKDENFRPYSDIKPFYYFYFKLAKQGKMPYNNTCKLIGKRLHQMLRQINRASIVLKGADEIATISANSFSSNLKLKLIETIITHNRETQWN